MRGTAYEAFNLPGEGGVDFPLNGWPVAGKTGTAEKQGKADFAWFAAFGPASWPERGFRHTPEVVVALVLEEAGFGARCGRAGRGPDPLSHRHRHSGEGFARPRKWTPATGR